MGVKIYIIQEKYIDYLRESDEKYDELLQELNVPRKKWLNKK